MSGIGPGSLIRKKGLHDDIDVGPKLLGRVLDAFSPLDGSDLNIKINSSKRKIELPPPNPSKPAAYKKTAPLGVRSLDSLLSFAEGQHRYHGRIWSW